MSAPLFYALLALVTLCASARLWLARRGGVGLSELVWGVALLPAATAFFFYIPHGYDHPASHYPRGVVLAVATLVLHYWGRWRVDRIAKKDADRQEHRG